MWKTWFGENQTEKNRNVDESGNIKKKTNKRGKI